MLEVLVLLLIGAQVCVRADPLVDCIDNCNVVGCYQTNGNPVNTRSIWNFVSGILRQCYSPRHECDCNFGLVFYKNDTIRDDDICDLFPGTTQDDEEKCLLNARAKQTTVQFVENNLDMCLDYLNRKMLDVTNRKCAYSVMIVASRDVQNPDRVRTEGKLLKEKGAMLYCNLIGNPATDANPVYREICDNIITPLDHDELLSNVETYATEHSCCRDPLPLATAAPPPVLPGVNSPTPPAPSATLASTVLCDGCTILNGVGYNPHPSRCDAWVRCTFLDLPGHIYLNRPTQTVISYCGCGTFWDQGVLTCIQSAHANCANDPCRSGGITKWAYVDNCRAYWTCENGLSSATECCDKGQRFDPDTLTCISSSTAECNDGCPCKMKPVAPDVTCPSRANPHDSTNGTYLVEEFQGKWTVMSCAPGTLYYSEECGCLRPPLSIGTATLAPLPKPDLVAKCPVEFSLNCVEKVTMTDWGNWSMLMDMANKVQIANEGVSVDSDNRRCIFDGKSKLVVHRFANFDWRDHFGVAVEFDDKGFHNNDGPLFSSGDCGERASILLRLTYVNGKRVVEGYMRNEHGVDFNVSLHFPAVQPTEVHLSYDGTHLTLCLKEGTDPVHPVVTNATGMVDRNKCAVQMGYSYPSSYLKGAIKKVLVYIHCVPEDFCASHNFFVL